MGGQCLPTFESAVPYPLRFMVDTDVVGGNWVEAPAGSYLVHTTNKMSLCCYEIDIMCVLTPI
jgi:DNA polymerase delta subunit 1